MRLRFEDVSCRVCVRAMVVGCKRSGVAQVRECALDKENVRTSSVSVVPPSTASCRVLLWFRTVTVTVRGLCDVILCRIELVIGQSIVIAAE